MRSARLQLLIVVTLAVAAGIGMAATRDYFVGLKTSENDWTRADTGTYVGQSFVANIDSISYIEWFVGSPSAPGFYVFDVLDQGTSQVVAHGRDTVPSRGWQWLRCDDFTYGSLKFTKGREYILKVSHSAGDSVNFVYRDDDPYKYGAISVGGGQSRPPPGSGSDLVARIYGRMNPVSDVWRACVSHATDDSGAEADKTVVKAESMGVRWLRVDFCGMDPWWQHDTATITSAYRRFKNASPYPFSMIGILGYGSNDNSKSSQGGKPGGDTWRHRYPPRYLWANPELGQVNYWACYCCSAMVHFPAVKYWEVWPEANSENFLREPDPLYYRNSSGGRIHTPRERCRLYVRMCRVAESVAHKLDGDTANPRRKVVGGATDRLLYWLIDYSTGDTATLSGVDWLKDVFELAKDSFGGVESCFDIVSVHPYMDVVYLDDSLRDTLWFDDARFNRELDTARSVMRQAGYPGMELWATEYGWPRWVWNGTLHPVTDTLMQARNLCQFYTSAIARQADPRGGYDRSFWYELTSYRTDSNDRKGTWGFGLLDSFPNQPRLPHGWAFTQESMLNGKRFNGRVMTDDTAANKHIRMYEFEDASGKRTWVCWKDGETGRDVGVKLPVRTNNLAAESLAYTRTAPAFSAPVANDGWLSMNLNSRPVFISEKTAPRRPDLGVDSVQHVRAGKVVRAWVTNHGTRATPVRSGSRSPYPTRALLRANGDSLARVTRTTAIAVNQQVEFTFDLGQTKLPDTVLFSVTVNPDQAYVELGTDDNTGYTSVVKP